MNRLTQFPAPGAEHGCEPHGCDATNGNDAPARENLSSRAMLPGDIPGGRIPAHETAATNPSPSPLPTVPSYGHAVELSDNGGLSPAGRPDRLPTPSPTELNVESSTLNVKRSSPSQTPPPPTTDGDRISYDGRSQLSEADTPKASDPLPPAREEDWREAQARAQLCEDFLDLTRHGYSLRQAARSLGKGVALFSGDQSMLAQYQRDGVAGLLPRRRASGAKPSFIVPDWFVPAARFFYLLANRTWNSGSVPEAIRRVISLPNLPAGWDARTKSRFLTALSPSPLGERAGERWQTPPVCPTELRELILSREREGKPLVPERLARQITAPASVVRQHRNPTEAGLGLLNAPGSMMWTTDAQTGERRFIRAGDIVEADDGTINFPVCVPWTMGGCPCSDKFGVKVGRFQFLRPVDAGSRFRPGYLYVARPSGSYRREDVLALMRMVCRAIGVPRGWRFERGTWESKMVTEAVRLLGSQLQTVYSPRQKPFVEGGFNQDWTKLSIHFPRADIGRFMGETEEANDLLTKCKRGTEDPRNHFPLLDTALRAFDQITREENATPVHSPNYGSWIPEERLRAHLEASPLRPLDPESEWIFSPFVREWTVKGITVGGRVPLFEEVSVPFDFSAPWLPKFHGKKVRVHFDPTEARCSAEIVLLEDHLTFKRGDVISRIPGHGPAMQVNETTGYVRLVMGWGDDPASLGRRLRQQAAAAMRREVRGIIPGRAGRSAPADAFGESELRDGLGQKAVMNHGDVSSSQVASSQVREDVRPSKPATFNLPPETKFDRNARLAELDAQEAALSHLFD